MKTAVYTSLCLCCLALLALPSLAAAPADQPATPAPVIGSFPIQPILLSTCTLQIECDDGSIVSCSGNSSCTTSNGGRCAVCDGVQAGCCAKTCCEDCYDTYYSCISTCDPGIPFSCRICDKVLTLCQNGCTGGCN